MLKKSLLLSVAMLLIACFLSGCFVVHITPSAGNDATITVEDAQTQDPEAAHNEVQATNTPSPTAEPTVEPTEAPANTSASGVHYTNESLGFSLEFPRSWEGKFSVYEFENGISVSFRPNVPVQEGKGHLFSLIKNPTEDDTDILDGTKYVETSDATYAYGGPTDVTYFEEDPQYDVFVFMRDEIDQVMKTIK